MIIHHFDLYPRDDPRDGARVIRFTQLQTAEYRGEANGTGSGKFTIRADTTDAGNIDPRGLQYIRVVQEDTVAATETVVGGFFLESGDFDALDTNTTRLLSFGGAGVLSYLSRSAMAPHTYIHDVFTGQDPFDDTWRLYAQSTVFANGNFLGAMLWRVIYEAQHYRNTATYTHRHGDGVEYTDSHDDDRLAADVGIPDLVMDFDQFLDSNGNAWDQTSGEFKAQVLENVQAVVQRLMQAGLYVEMDPDSFELRAYQADDHRRDRTGTVWGASVIYLTRPTGDDIDTGNIKDKLRRAIRAFIKRRTLWVGGQDVYSKVTGTTDIPWEGGLYSDTNDTDALTQIGNVQIGARDDAGDTLRFPIRVGNAASSGYYRPFVDILNDDLVTVNSGSGQFDITDQDFPVAAITVYMRPGGDWGCIVDLGSSYTATPNRQFQVSPVPAHNHPPPLPDERMEYLETHRPFLITAHRGDINPTDGYPENTVEAIRQAAIRGADRIEIDVRPSADGTWHALLDRSVARTTDGSGNIDALTDATIAALNIDGGFGYNAARHGTSLDLPTLAEIITAIRPYDVVLELDPRDGDGEVCSDAGHRSLAQYIRGVIPEMVPRTTIRAKSLTGAAAIKATDRRFQVAALDSVIATPESDGRVDQLNYEYTDDAVDAAKILARAPDQVTVYQEVVAFYGTDEAAKIRNVFEWGARSWATQNLPAALAVRNELLYSSSSASAPGTDASAAMLVAFRTALAKRATTPVDIVCIGDSGTEGSDATSVTSRWVARLQAQLRGHMQPTGVRGGAGYLAAVHTGSVPSAFTEGGTIVDNFTYGLGRRSAELNSTSDTLTLTVRATGFDILWAQVSGGGTFSYAVDGGSATNVSTSGTTEGGHVTSIRELASGDHTLVLTGVSGTAIIEGVMVYDGDEDAGIRVWEGGHSGYQTSDYTGSTTWRDSLETVQPDLVIIGLGVNEWRNDVAVATFKTNLETLVADVRTSVTTDPSIVLLAYWEVTNATPTGTWDDFTAAMDEIAAADDAITFVNLDERLDHADVADLQTVGLIDSDGIHGLDPGHQFVADALADVLSLPGVEWHDPMTGGHWEPVTNGDVTTPEIVFDNGDVVMEWVI